MIINTDTLIRLLSNMTLFCGPKTQTGGVIHFSTKGHPSYLTAVASDDYVIIQQVEEIEPTDVEEEFFLPHADVKKAIKSIEETWQDYTIPFTGEGIKVDNPNPELWKAVLQIPGDIKEKNRGTAFSPPMAIRPERLSKFSRLKAEKEYPIDLVIEKSKILNDKDVFFFRYGPTIKGVLSPILRSVVKEAFADEEGVLWEE